MNTPLPPAPEGADFEYVPYEKPIADAVDALMAWQKRMGYPQKVETETHWAFLEKLFDMFVTLYPDEYERFRKWQVRLKKDKKTKNAIIKEGNAMIQHQLEIPRKFVDMIQAMFPQQKVTEKKFVAKLMVKMPLLSVK